jgi:hypothetical protein
MYFKKVLLMEDLQTNTPQAMARILELASANPGLWRREELHAILSSQFADSFPNALSLDDYASSLRGTFLRLAEFAGIENFAALFHHPQPPAELLRLAKEYGKYNRQNPRSELPPEVSTLLYFIWIALGLVRRGQRISTLDNAALRQGFSWALAQPWLDEPYKEVFRQALASF